jgi:hypothetical protein
VKVMVDNDLPPRLAIALNTIFEPDGDQVVALRHKFGRSNVKDEEWIPALGDEGGWAVISADQRIAKRKPSRELFIRNGLVGFFFSPGLQKSPLHKQAARLLTLWPQIKAQHGLAANGCFALPVKSSKFESIGR